MHPSHATIWLIDRDPGIRRLTWYCAFNPAKRVAFSAVPFEASEKLPQERRPPERINSRVMRAVDNLRMGFQQRMETADSYVHRQNTGA